jgi:hypothetical protein
MADLSLKIRLDAESAAKQFNELAATSEAAREKIEKFAKGFENDHVDKFIDKQKLAGAAITAARGEVAAMEAQQAAYGREIERLIKAGLSPESEAVKRLSDEQQNLKAKIKDANDVQKAQADLMKAAEKAALACFAAIGAGIAAIGAMTQKTAEMGDGYAKASRAIGMTAETLQELEYAAKQSGVSDLTGSLQKLTKSVIEAKNGAGKLTAALKDTNPQLLAQIKNAKSNEEAFNLMMAAIKEAPDSFSKAELATAAFGKSGQQMILMAESGAEGLAALREEARKYGVISNESAAASEAYIDAQTRLKAALTGVQTELTSKLLPGVTQAMNKIAEFIASIDNWGEILTKAGYALAGLAAGLTAFLVVSKGAAVIHAVATAFRALTAAMAANPIGAIAVAITAVLIPALIYLYKNWDIVQTYIQQGTARLEYAFKFLTASFSGGWETAFDFVKIALAKWLEIWFDGITLAVRTVLGLLTHLPGQAGEMAEKALDAINVVRSGLDSLTDAAIASSSAATQATLAALDAELGSIDENAKARRAELEAKKKEAQEEMQVAMETADAEIAEMERVEKEKKARGERQKTEIELFRERLNAIALTERQAQNEQIDAVTQFLRQRAQLESDDYARQIEYIETHKQEMLDLYEAGSNERIAIEMALAAEIEAIQKKQADNAISIFNQFGDAVGNFAQALLNVQNSYLQDRLKALDATSKAGLEAHANALKDELANENLTEKEKTAIKESAEKQKTAIEKKYSDERKKIIDEANKEAQAAAVFQRVLANAEAIIQTYLAASKALAQFGGVPTGLPAMAATIVQGLANAAILNSTPIPKLSAETGGRFVVPDVSPRRVDGVGLRVNPGETIDVTPRGEAGESASFNFRFVFNDHVFAEIVNSLARSGELYTLRLARNV